MKSPGITLIELLITIAITSILLVSAVPSFISLYQEHHLKTTVENLYYILKYAQSEAIKNNTTVYVNFGTGDNWCFGAKSGSNCSCSTANSCTLSNTSTAKTQDLSLAVTGMSSNSIQFEGTHGATNSNSTAIFTIYNQSSAMGVKISAFGNIQICSSTYSGYTACS